MAALVSVAKLKRAILPPLVKIQNLTDVQLL